MDADKAPWLGRLADWYIIFSARNAALILLLGLGLAVAGGWSANKIKVDPRLESLLPSGTPGGLALDELRQRVPSSSPLMFLIASSDGASNRLLAEAIQKGAAQWPETTLTFVRRDPGYFLERRLLYMQQADLESLADSLEETVSWHRCDATPGCISFSDEPEPIDLEPYARRLAEQPQVRALLGLLGQGTGAASAAARKTAQPAAESEPQKVEDVFALGSDDPDLGRLCSKDSTTCAVQVELEGNPRDIDFAELILARGQKLLADAQAALPSVPPDLKTAVSGPYRNAPLIRRTVLSDIARTALVGFVLVGALLMLQFRGLRALLLLATPLLASVCWTIGWLALFHPRLNLISASSFAILAGLGVDFGVHLITHYGHERSKGLEPADALRSTYRTLGGSMMVAALTTAFGFAALLPARFQGFSEMGALVPLAILSAWIGFVALTPPLVFLMHRFWAERRSPIRSWRHRSGASRHDKSLARAGLALAVVGVLLGLNLGFEYNFKKLEPGGLRTGIRGSEALHGTERRAIVMLADEADDLEAAAAALRAQESDEIVNDDTPWIVTPTSFIPTGQGARLEQIARMRKSVATARKYADDDESAKLDQLSELVAVSAPITPSDLPAWARSWVVESDGSLGRFGLIYTEASGSDARAMETLARRLDTWREDFPRVRFASSDALLGTIVPALRDDVPVIICLALAGLIVGTLIAGRSLRITGLVLAPLFAAMAVALGCLVVAGLKVNLYNMLVFPAAFGIGVDGAIYVVWASRGARGGFADRLASSRRAVLGSTTTSMAGFGALAAAENPGLASLGWVALITLGMTLLANVVWLPAVLRAWVLPRKTASQGSADAVGGRP